MSSAREHLFRRHVVIDGSGQPPFVGDVRIRAGLVVEIGQDLAAASSAVHGHHLPGQEATVSDGLGRWALSPGFIDVHTHDDAQILLQPEMPAKISQGVTTVVAGNCGLSLVPLVTQRPEAPLDILSTTCFRFSTLEQYAQAVDQALPAVNLAALVGHTALRCSVMPELDRAATEQELARMGDLLSDALQAGALGLSSGVFYKPAYAADMAELVALCRRCAAHGGIYVTHIRTELDGILQAMQEAADTAKAGQVGLVYSHHKCAGPKNWGRALQTLAFIDQLRQQQEVSLDVYPYTAGSTLLREDLIDPAIDILITRSEPHPQVVGQYLADIAREWDMGLIDCARALMPGGACYFQVHEQDLQRVLAHPMSMIGSDGLPHDQRPHPRLWGTFPRVLGHYARDLALMPLEQAVHKMTGLTAQRMGLKDRGCIAVGAVADLVVFDPSSVADRATYAQPVAPSEGIFQVYVDGHLAWSHGQLLGRHGRFVRRGQRSEFA